MNERDKELAKQAWTENDWDGHVDIPKLIQLVRADERENFVAFIQSYPHWLGNKAKEEIVQEIRKRGNT